MKNKVHIQVIRAWNELFRFMALRTRHISFTLFISELRSLSQDQHSYVHRWTPLNSHGPHWISFDKLGNGGYRWNTFLPSLILIWLPILFRVKRILLPLEGIMNRILPVPSGNYVSHWCILEMYGNISISNFLFFFFFRCLGQRNTKQKIR